MVTRFRRYGQIVDILVKYGFGIVIEDLFPGIRRIRLPIKSPEERQSIYVRIRLAIEELGPTFIKFGQIMSTRQELLPPPLIEELTKLQDQVKPVPFSELHSYLNEACPHALDCFREIDQHAFASASISQVHSAILNDGTKVAIKIQRPGIEDIIETDIAILQSLAARVEVNYPDARVYNPRGMVKDFASQIRRELDFIHDGKNAERLAMNFRDVPGIRFPRIFWEYSSRHVLVMEFIEGVRIDNVGGIRDLGLEPAEIADRGFHAYLKMILEDGFFHGDPHPGNLLITPAGEIAFLDFGVVGVLRPEKRQMFILLLYSIVERDVEMMIKAFEGLGVVIREEDRDPLRDDIYIALLDAHQFVIGQHTFSGMVASLTDVLRRYHIQVPQNLMLMLKVLVMIYDTGVRLDPHFDFIRKVKPYLDSLSIKDILSPQILNRATHSLIEAIDGVFDLPRNINQTLKKFASGTVRLEIIETDLKKFQRSVDRASDKILVGMITSAVVIGSSLVLLGSRLAIPPQVSWLAIIGYSAAMVVGFYALYHVFFAKGSDDE